MLHELAIVAMLCNSHQTSLRALTRVRRKKNTHRDTKNTKLTKNTRHEERKLYSSFTNTHWLACTSTPGTHVRAGCSVTSRFSSFSEGPLAWCSTRGKKDVNRPEEFLEGVGSTVYSDSDKERSNSAATGWRWEESNTAPCFCLLVSVLFHHGGYLPVHFMWCVCAFKRGSVNQRRL